MAKTQGKKGKVAPTRTQRAKLTAEESLKRMQDFAKRKEQFVDVVRKGKGRSLTA
jgi:hypothetical protein